MKIGHASIGEGHEQARIDLMIGTKSGPSGVAFAQSFAQQKVGHPRLLATLVPNLLVKPATLIVSVKTIRCACQAVSLFGTVQQAVAHAVADSVVEGIIPADQAEDLVIICGVFIHWEASEDKKIFQYNYEATKLAIARAMKAEPTSEEMLSKKDQAKHPFANVEDDTTDLVLEEDLLAE